jgi:hypothetical protein
VWGSVFLVLKVQKLGKGKSNLSIVPLWVNRGKGITRINHHPAPTWAPPSAKEKPTEMVKMRVTGSGRSSRCAPPDIVPSAPSVPCSALGDRRIEGALTWCATRYLIGFSRRFVPPRNL